MSHQTTTLVLRLRLAWWFRPYCWALTFFCMLHRTMPDPDKLRCIMARATRFEYVPAPAATPDEVLS